MRYHTAKELDGHRIRIECSGDIPVGKNVQITDLETGEPILNVEYIQITIAPKEAITAQLLLGFVGEMEEQPDGGLRAQTWSEQLTVNNPEIDLTAFAEPEHPGQAAQGGKQ